MLEVSRSLPLYDSEGHLKAFIVLKRLTVLVESGRVTVVYSRRGKPLRAQEIDPNPQPLSPPPYSYNEKLPRACKRAWTLRRLGGVRGWNFAAADVRPIFMAVVTSCLASAEAGA